MDTKKNVCLVFRGELLRNTSSWYHNNNKVKKLKKYNLSDESFIRQDNIIKSIINHIILPYEKNGFNVLVSGCIYKCPNYDNNLMSFFPKNTIKQIKSGKTNQAELFYKSIKRAIIEHPNCIEYISLRLDYIMLKDIIRKDFDLNSSYVGFPWKNTNYPDVDVFFIISKNAMNIFKDILYRIGSGKNYAKTHSVLNSLKDKNVLLYQMWSNYENKATGISYREYTRKIKLHENRPLVNFMRIHLCDN